MIEDWGTWDIMDLVYGNNSISSLKDEEQVRKRPAVIFGTNDIHGCAHSIFEIIANAIDEVREGYGDIIKVEVQEDNIISVIDNGRGVPMDWNESEGKYNWELVFCTLYASGKYDSNSYMASLGLNGLGATATQYASEFMEVVSIRDDKLYTMNFEMGKPVGEMKVRPADGAPSGTRITFKPDKEVFTDIDVTVEYYLDVLRRQAMLHKNLKIILKYHNRREIVLHYPGGVKDFIDIVCEKRIIPEIINFVGQDTGCEDEDAEPYNVNMELTMVFSRDTSLIEMYHNSSYLSDGGSSYDAMIYALSKAIEDYAKQSGKIGKNDKILYRDIEELLVLIGTTECNAGITYFKNQTKTAITNKFIRRAYVNFVYYNFTRWLTENKAHADRVLTEVLANKYARESADAVKKKVIKKLSKSIDTYQGRPRKLVASLTNNPFERELYIVEGDSAATSCVLARNRRFQDIMPIRGKIMNCLKEDLTRILNSEIIIDLIRVLGCGIEAESKYVKDLPKFNIEKLNYCKVIICTDADLDGMQIRCLILTMIYRLMPTLLRKGKVFIAETPLYEIGVKDDTLFAYDENEKEDIVNSLINKGYSRNKISLQRSKGLGENDPEMMSVSTMNPDTRRLISIDYPEDEKSVALVFKSLLGDDIESRRYMIEQYFDVGIDID